MNSWKKRLGAVIAPAPAELCTGGDLPPRRDEPCLRPGCEAATFLSCCLSNLEKSRRAWLAAPGRLLIPDLLTHFNSADRVLELSEG